MIKISDIENPDDVLRRTGKEISLCACELHELANSLHSELYEALKLLDFAPKSNLIASIDEAIRFTEEVDMIVPAIIEKGEYFSKLGEKLLFGPVAPPFRFINRED